MPEFFEKPNQSQDHPDQQKNDQETIRTLLEWTAPARPFRKKERSYYTTIATIVVLLILIALLAREFLLIGALIALTFVIYVLGFVPPGESKYRISTQGVTIGEQFYLWMDLDIFWFSEKEGFKVLNILTHLRFPAQLMLVLKDQDEAGVKKIVAKYLPFYEIAPKSLLENWGQSLQKHFPLENPHK